ncbi:MAG: TonB-dependent receptor [Pseudomonadota bacterium]
MKTKLLVSSAVGLALLGTSWAQEDESNNSDVIIVSGTRGALSEALREERAADGFKSVISADDIGQFADQNIAETLQRVPGVSITRDEGEGQQLSIRGLPTDFATITIDGARLGTRDPESNAVNLDILSSDLLSGIEVIKTLTPDLDADSVAGQVNLRTLSAITRGKDSVSGRIETGYEGKAEEYNPRISGDFTKLFERDAGGLIGIAGGISYQRRETVVDDFRVNDGLRYVCVEQGLVFDDDADDYNCQENPELADESFLAVRRIDQRNDPAERTRISGNLNLEYQPSENQLFYARGTYAYFEDTDIRARERIELDDGSNDLDEAPDEIQAINATGGVFEDVDFSKRFRFTDQEDTALTFSIGGENTFSDGKWEIDYGFDYSKNESDIPSVEARFRTRDNIVTTSNQSEDGIDFSVVSEDGEALLPEDFDFRFITQFDNFSTDEITAFKVNMARNFQAFGNDASVKFGVKLQERERTLDVNRANIETDLISDLSQFDTSVPSQTDLDLLFFPNLGQLRSVTLEGAATGSVDDNALFASFANVAEDFEVEEEILSGYFMTTFSPVEKLQIIAGVRVEATDLSTTGTRYNVIEYEEDATDLFADAFEAGGIDGTAQADAFLEDRVSTVIFEDQSQTNDYVDVFPNLQMRWDVRDDVVVRASYTEAIKRPRYNEIAATTGFTTVEDIDADDVEDAIDALGGSITDIAQAEQIVADIGGANRFQVRGEDIRNPQLDPLRAKQFDASVAWYPNDNAVLSVAAFYKDIDDFIVRVGVAGDDVTQFGFPVADGSLDGGPEQLETFVNGDSAEVYGVELNYYQAYTFLPGPFDGLFAQANLTLSESEATTGITQRTITLPEQADTIGNISVGYENDKVTLRWSGNYQGERFRGINTAQLEDLDDPAGDELEAERWSMDINARYRITETVQLYFDAININDAEDIRRFRGDSTSGQIYSRIENYGATYQLGVRFRF